MLVCEHGHRTPFLCNECDSRFLAKTERVTGEEATRIIKEAQTTSEEEETPFDEALPENYVTTKLSVSELIRETEDLRLYREMAQKKLNNPNVLSSIEKAKVKGRTLSSLLGKHQQLAMKWMNTDWTSLEFFEIGGPIDGIAFPGLAQFQVEKQGVSVSQQYNLARKYIHRIVLVDSKFGKSSVTPLQQWLMELVNKERAVQAEVFDWAAFQKSLMAQTLATYNEKLDNERDLAASKPSLPKKPQQTRATILVASQRGTEVN